ncbi:MAG: PD-(D/E)XK nuclease family protein [Anaerolineae bacterium]|nr:PD-(D/E)XK nuclease family protein [Anaerolineae bacterium]
MARLSAEHDALVRDGRWVVGVDDILSIIGRSRHEAYHSAMLAWLLNPLAKHGMGAALLSRLLQRCGVEDGPSRHRARVECEVVRGNTRADIVAFCPDVTLIVENKVDAGEQERQCDRLYEHFGNEPGAVFLYLTPDGRPPQTATGAARDAWTVLRYRDLATMLAAILPQATTGELPAGLAAAHNYLATLRREFP